MVSLEALRFVVLRGEFGEIWLVRDVGLVYASGEQHGLLREELACLGGLSKNTLAQHDDFLL